MLVLPAIASVIVVLVSSTPQSAPNTPVSVPIRLRKSAWEIVVAGVIPANATRFAINLLVKCPNSGPRNCIIPLHMSFRWDETPLRSFITFNPSLISTIARNVDIPQRPPQLVINSLIGGEWGKEQRYDNPYQKNDSFIVTITLRDFGFEIEPRMEHELRFYDYKIGLPLITHIEVAGTAHVESIDSRAIVTQFDTHISTDPDEVQWTYSGAETPRNESMGCCSSSYLTCGEVMACPGGQAFDAGTGACIPKQSSLECDEYWAEQAKNYFIQHNCNCQASGRRRRRRGIFCTGCKELLRALGNSALAMGDVGKKALLLKCAVNPVYLPLCILLMRGYDVMVRDIENSTSPTEICDWLIGGCVGGRRRREAEKNLPSEAQLAAAEASMTGASRPTLGPRYDITPLSNALGAILNDIPSLVQDRMKRDELMRNLHQELIKFSHSLPLAEWSSDKDGFHQSEYLYQGFYTVAMANAARKFGPEVPRTYNIDQSNRVDHIAMDARGVGALVSEMKCKATKQWDTRDKEQALGYHQLVKGVHDRVRSICYILTNFGKKTKQVRMAYYCHDRPKEEDDPNYTHGGPADRVKLKKRCFGDTKWVSPNPWWYPDVVWTELEDES